MHQINTLILEEARTSMTLYPPMAQTEAHAPFKKSHTCGSLYANCACSAPAQGPPRPQTGHHTKRLSSPEIRDTHSTSPRDTKPKAVIKANVYLNHPEITFPIPVELPRSPSIDHGELKRANLDYHKYSALVYGEAGKVGGFISYFFFKNL